MALRKKPISAVSLGGFAQPLDRSKRGLNAQIDSLVKLGESRMNKIGQAWTFAKLEANFLAEGIGTTKISLKGIRRRIRTVDRCRVASARTQACSKNEKEGALRGFLDIRADSVSLPHQPERRREFAFAVQHTKERFA